MLFYLKGGRTFTGGTERKLEIIKYICRVRKTTFRELANEFGVSVRTIQRDIDSLSVDMCIPIYTQPGKYGGVFIDKDYTFDRMYMTQNETDLLIKLKYLVVDTISEKEMILLDYVIKVYQKPKKEIA